MLRAEGIGARLAEKFALGSTLVAVMPWAVPCATGQLVHAKTVHAVHLGAVLNTTKRRQRMGGGNFRTHHRYGKGGKSKEMREQTQKEIAPAKGTWHRALGTGGNRQKGKHSRGKRRIGP